VLWLRSAFFAAILPGTVAVWVPLWLSTAPQGRLDIGALRWAGLPVLVLGAVGLVWCIWEFGHRGRGTLAPVDPPRFVVREGLYRLVRNPMYLSVLATLLGEGLLFRSSLILAWAVTMAVAFHLFVVAYEEPTLRRRFGSDYDTYCRAVPRWWPSLTGQDRA
jgi:protein-S-isoprenylcysteine O-methyltransferase Ste14